MHGERLGKDPAEIEHEYEEMIREDTLAAINQSYVSRDRFEHGTPLEEFECEALISLALSYHPEEPPDRIIAEIARAFDNLASDPIMNAIDAGYFKEVFSTPPGIAWVVL